ncbi:hypothetical protein D9M71_666160 [compost metagenome]
MRFNSPDSWSPFGEGGINPYTYCGGDPRNRFDPNGHAFKFFLPFSKASGLFEIPRPKFTYKKAATSFSYKTVTPLNSSPEISKLSTKELVSGVHGEITAPQGLLAKIPETNPLTRRPSLEKLRSKTLAIIESKLPEAEKNYEFWSKIDKKKRSFFRNSADIYH